MKGSLKKLESSKGLRILLIIVPFILGFAGYWEYYHTVGRPLTWAFCSVLYSTIRLYAFAIDASRDPAVSGITWYYILLEIARFWAAGVTGTALYRVIKPHLEDLLTRLKASRKNSIVLYGSPSVTSILKDSMDDYRVIDQNPSRERFHSNQHLIAFDSDEESLQFLRENQAALVGEPGQKERVIYLCVHSSGLGLTNDSVIKISCMAENCARMFWERHYLNRFGRGCPQSEDQIPKKRSKIIMIGFGEYGEALLNQALQVNVFLRDSPGVEYHIWGDGRDYLLRHPQLSQIVSYDKSCALTEDYLEFHSEEDYASLAEIYKDADRIIIAADSDVANYRVFCILCCRFMQLPHIYIRLKTDRIMDSVYHAPTRPKLGDALYGVDFTVFGTDEELYTKDIVINEALQRAARQTHSWYAKRYPGVPAWDGIGTVKQRSNIAAADHLSVKIRQFLKRDCSLNAKSHADYKKKFNKDRGIHSYLYAYLEMEHVRWCRFYYLQGWEYADEKDEEKRRHNCLKAFDDLDEALKVLDMDSFLVLYDYEFA